MGTFCLRFEGDELYGVRTADIYLPYLGTYLLPSRKIHVPTEVGYSKSKMGALQSTNRPTN